MESFLKYIVLIFMIQGAFTDAYHYKSYTFTQKVDHFSFSNPDTFKQRYLVSDEFWATENNTGPIFFYTGNEGDIVLFAENTGFMWEIAQKFHARVVFAEHRYYGVSMPYGDKSFSAPIYTGYLTSEQALADFVELCQHIRSDSMGNVPIIAFGGSYGGMLSAWFRMKYPHVVQGAIAASAPILQFTDVTPCENFGEVVTKDFENHYCADYIRKSWNALNRMGASAKGIDWINKEWRLCQPLKVSSHIKALKDYLIDIWTNLAMVNYPYPANFLAPLPGMPVKAVCDAILKKYDNATGSDDEILLTSIYAGLNVYTNYTGVAKCVDIRQNADQRLDDRGWDYQSCTEMVMPFCYNGKTDMFEPSNWNFTAFSIACNLRWKSDPLAYRIPLYYGAHDLSGASNIVFSNGLLDPWSSGGVLKNVSDSVIAVIIPEGAHHIDLRAKDVNDPPSVRAARETEQLMITKWIKEFHEHNPNDTPMA